ncbi:MAG: hypothetical protein Ta2G_15520 [Termitinemataceae bacterium]|nr:MAG: hypothetical protein Ta2G_15520 [Termitinemataceae bacterium]
MFQIDNDDFFLFNNDEIDKLVKNSRPRIAAQKSNSRFHLPVAPKKDGEWVMAGTPVTVGGYKIESGFFYYGTYLPSRYLENETSLINPKLPVGNVTKLYGSRPPANPCYAKWDANQRAEYLNWLAAGRPVSHDTTMWYLKVFFMGIERRLIIDNELGLVKTAEKQALKKETERIFTSLPPLAEYGDYGKEAFQVLTNVRRNYAHLLEMLEVTMQTSPFYTKGISLSFTDFEKPPLLPQIALAECLKEGENVPADIAFAWYESEKAFKHYKAFTNCNSAFKKVFAEMYNKKFPKGINLKKAGGTFSHYDYETVSSALTPCVRYKLREPFSVVDFSKSVVEKINALGIECTKLIDDYYRKYIKSNDVEKKTCFFLLPSFCYEQYQLNLDDIYGDKETEKSFAAMLNSCRNFDTKHKKAIIAYLVKNVFRGNAGSFEALSVLEKVYKKFGFDESALYSSLANNGAVSVPHNSSNESTELVLDKNKIVSLRKDSEQVSCLLADIFSDKDSIAEDAKTPEKNPLSLDTKHTAFLSDLVQKDVWGEGDLQQLAKTHSLMAEGAIETINEASFNFFDEALIEDETASKQVFYRCNASLAQKLKKAFAA